MTKVSVVAAALIFSLACVFLGFVFFGDRNGLGVKQRIWCHEYLQTIASEKETARLVSWADAEIFSRNFERKDFRFGHFAGPRKPSHTLDTVKGALRHPEWMPAHYEIRVLGRTGSEFNSVFITGGRYRGYVVVRQGWQEAFDGLHLSPDMISVQRGRVGVVCYVD